MSDGKVVYEVRADYDKLESDLEGANSKIEKGTSKWGSLLQGVGQGIGHFVADKAVEAAAAVWELGTAFEDGLAKVSTLVDTASVDMNQLGDSLLDLSSKYGLEASNLAESAYNAISSNNALGKDTESLMKVLESSAKLAKAGFTDVDTAASATLKTLNAYGLGVESVDRIQKVLIQTQNTGITTVGELGAVLAQVTPSAAAVGIQFEEVGAALATMTAQGTPAAQATTQLNAVITAFLKPTKQMKIGLFDMANEMIHAGELSSETAEDFLYVQQNITKLCQEQEKLDTSTKEGNKRWKELEECVKGCQEEMFDLAAEMSIEILQTKGLQGTLEGLNEVLFGSTTRMADALSSTEALKAMLAITGQNAETFTSNLHAMSTETDVVGEGFEKVAGTASEKMNRSLSTLKASAIGLYQAIQPLLTILLDIAAVLVSKVASAINTASDWLGTMASKVSNLWSTITGGSKNSKSNGRSYAVGNDFVPEDNYPALLHRGEAVLTAAEAKIWRAGGNTRTGQLSSTISGGSSLDYDKLARAMSGMTVVMDGKTVGRLVEGHVSAQQARRVESMQRSGFNGRL